MLKICTSATDDTLATTGDVMLLLFGSTSTAALGSTADLDYLSRLSRRASVWAEGFVGYPFPLQVYSETVSGDGGPYLMLSRTPVVKVLRFFDATDTGNATAICSTDFRVESAAAGLLSRQGGWRWTNEQFAWETCFNLGLSPAYLPGRETKPWLVEYVAGYRVTGSTVTCMGVSSGDTAYTTQATLPDDVVQAVAARAAEIYANPTGLRSRRIGDLAVDYASAAPSGAGSGAADLLSPYRRYS